MADTVEVTEYVPGKRWAEIQPETEEFLVTKTRLSTGRVEDSYPEFETVETKQGPAQSNGTRDRRRLSLDSYPGGRLVFDYSLGSIKALSLDES